MMLNPYRAEAQAVMPSLPRTGESAIDQQSERRSDQQSEQKADQQLDQNLDQQSEQTPDQRSDRQRADQVMRSRKPDSREIRAPKTNVIPSLKLSERYDSNVFFVQGANLEDYVTTMSPQLKVLHRRQLVEGTIGGGVTAEAYVKNPGLNYVAGNGFLDLNLDRAMNELVPGLGLRISDTFYYTPQPPAFAAPTGGSQVPPAFVRGIQVQRTNSHTNFATAEGSYSVSPVLDVVAIYRDQRMKFGSPIPAPDGTITARFIDTTSQTVTSGPVVKTSPLDTVKLWYLYQKGSFEFSGQTPSYSDQGPIAGWTRSITPTLKGSVEAGVVVLSIDSSVQPLAAASLEWRGRDTDVTLSYSRIITPSILDVPTPLLSQLVTGTVAHRVTPSLVLSLSANYGLNHSIPDSSLINFTSYSVTPSIGYTINRVLTATLSYSRSQFQQEFSSQELRFDRNVILVSLFAEWK
jgi:hypothetical protein